MSGGLKLTKFILEILDVSWPKYVDSLFTGNAEINKFLSSRDVEVMSFGFSRT